jgi:hypothetical protein
MREGWSQAGPEDDEGQALPVTGLLMSVRGSQDEGRTLGQVLARAMRPDKPAELPDPDERAANMLARGYSPGTMSVLSSRLGEAQAELAGEREKLEADAKWNERVQRDHAAGRISATDIARSWMARDEGDADKVARLERRVASLQRQLGDVTAVIAPQGQQFADPVEQASRHAHQVFVETTRQRMADAAAGRAPRARRPFASISRGAAGGDEVPECEHCAGMGATAEESFLMHSDPELLPAGGPDTGYPS